MVLLSLRVIVLRVNCRVMVLFLGVCLRLCFLLNLHFGSSIEESGDNLNFCRSAPKPIFPEFSSPRGDGSLLSTVRTKAKTSTSHLSCGENEVFFLKKQPSTQQQPLPLQSQQAQPRTRKEQQWAGQRTGQKAPP